MTISILTLWFYILVFYSVIGTWNLFEKAGRKKWEGFLPVYNIFIWTKVINKPWWWGLILLVPGWNQLLMLGAMNVSMGRIYGKYSAKDTIMQILVPFIYFPMLAYDKNLTYEGETNWDVKEEREKRKISDHIALFFASFGIINVLVILLKLTGTKDKPGQKSVVKEWGDSIIFALIAASMIRGYVLEAFTIPTPSMEKEMLVGDFLFVNKLAYGTRVPLTPISFPLAHNTIPFTYVNSYSTAIKLPYYRLPGLGDVVRNDIVVFNHPVGDTAVFGRYPDSEGAGGELQGHNYYEFVRSEAARKARNDAYSNPKIKTYINEYRYEMDRLNKLTYKFDNSNDSLEKKNLTKIINEQKTLVEQKSSFIEEKMNQFFFFQKGKYEAEARHNILDNLLMYDYSVGDYFELAGYTTRPIDKKENYVKRCVAVAGDTLEIKDGVLLINGKFNNVGVNVNFNHDVEFSRRLSPTEFELFKDAYGFNLGQYKDIKHEDRQKYNLLPVSRFAIINMSKDVKEQLIKDIKAKKYGNLEIISVKQHNDKEKNPTYAYQHIYPNHEKFPWTVDNYGPLWMPKQGVTIALNEDNWIKYSRCINTYENNSYAWVNGAVVDEKGQKVENYTFKQNYYYMIGDNRHNSADSRMWGFVPEDHVVGKTLITFMSKDQERGWFNGGIRWSRIFKTF